MSMRVRLRGGSCHQQDVSPVSLVRRAQAGCKSNPEVDAGGFLQRQSTESARGVHLARNGQRFAAPRRL